MKDNLKKMEMIQEKMEQLKAKQKEIEQELISNFVQVLKINNAFQIDFDIIVGGILETIDTIRSDPVKTEVWRQNGNKFCKSRIISGTKKAKKIDKKLENEYV